MKGSSGAPQITLQAIALPPTMSPVLTDNMMELFAQEGKRPADRKMSASIEKASKDRELRELRELKELKELNNHEFRLPSINLRKPIDDGYKVEGRRMQIARLEEPDRSEVKALSSAKVSSKVKMVQSTKIMKRSSPLIRRVRVVRDEVRSSPDEIQEKQGSKNKTMHSKVKSSSISQKRIKLTVSYQEWCLFIAALSGVAVPVGNATYKAYVGKGNNSILIKNVVKNRFWWNISESQVDCNLYWLQSRDNKYIATLKSNDNGGSDPSQPSSENPFTPTKRFQLEKMDRKEGKQELLRDLTSMGLWRLMSKREREMYSKNPFQAQLPTPPRVLGLRIRMHNHLEFNWNLTNKKALYYNLREYYRAIKVDPFENIPLTFHVQKEGDEEWQHFMKYYAQREEALGIKKKRREKNLWIIKPGQNSNQGCGIQVAQTVEQIREIIRSKEESVKKRSHIVQRYLMPLLYNKRKFDIRCYLLVTAIGGHVRAYWYEEGYIRTSCKEFSIKNLKNRFIHLTNDAVQKKCEDYGKYQNGNKLSYPDFQRYLNNFYPGRDFFREIYPRMMALAADSIRSVHTILDAAQREYTFQVFGLDFMIDEEFVTWLIEVNNNPCLELGCPLLARIIPSMIQNALRIAVDPLFPPPREYMKSKNLATDLFETNKFSLVFDSKEEQVYVGERDRDLTNIVESDEEQENHDD